MRRNIARIVVLLGAGFTVLTLASIFYVINRPTEQELFAEQIIHSYIEVKGIHIQPNTSEYKSLMRGILLGESELTQIGMGYVNNQEELDCILDYAWERSGYKELYGKYHEPDIAEAKIPTPTILPTEENVER